MSCGANHGGSRKILAELHGSRSCFFSGSVRLTVSQVFFAKPFSFESRSRSRNCNLKIQTVSVVSRRKTLVSPSRKVSNISFATPRGVNRGVNRSCQNLKWDRINADAFVRLATKYASRLFTYVGSIQSRQYSYKLSRRQWLMVAVCILTARHVTHCT